MIKIVEDPRIISKYQKQFINELKKSCNEKINCTIGYQSGSTYTTVQYSKQHNFWYKSRLEPNRFWNAFGYGRPEINKGNSLIVEVNFPFEGINRRTGGAFGIDSNNQVLILHRGNIGGGRVGIGKKLFLDHFRGKPVVADDGGIENEFHLIGELNSDFLSLQTSNFIYEISRLKKLNSEEIDLSSKLNAFTFINEKSGKHEIISSSTRIIERTHGIVVNALAKVLEDFELNVSNDKNRDLFTHEGGKITKLFEVKRSCSSQHLYSAVGQLIIYSMPINNPVDLILVLPQKLTKTVEAKLKHLGMTVLYYDWNEGNPEFYNLKEILNLEH
ncbi:hypothetical protein MRBLMN1_004873 [Chitinophaga ginsengisegetis]|uniref:hypothetical protein n=1 Tax=Chitinophaga ginsengisegetis TaxID=393003 RepID=UPI00342F958D